MTEWRVKTMKTSIIATYMHGLLACWSDTTNRLSRLGPLPKNHPDSLSSSRSQPNNKNETHDTGKVSQGLMSCWTNWIEGSVLSIALQSQQIMRLPFRALQNLTRAESCTGTSNHLSTFLCDRCTIASLSYDPYRVCLVQFLL